MLHTLQLTHTHNMDCSLFKTFPIFTMLQNILLLKHFPKDKHLGYFPFWAMINL